MKATKKQRAIDRRRVFVGLRARIEDLHDLMTLLMSWLNRFYLFFSGLPREGGLGLMDLMVSR